MAKKKKRASIEAIHKSNRKLRKKIKALEKVELKWIKREGCWMVVQGWNLWSYTTKTAAMRQARSVAWLNQPSSLVIRKKDGKFQEERTYPRSRDPRKSKG